MKAVKWMASAAMAALVLLTSCLGDGDNTISRRGFAVGGIAKDYKPIVFTMMGQLHSPSLGSKVVDRGCYVVNYDIDFNAAGNENAMVNEYYLANVTVLDEVTKGYFVPHMSSDTTQLMPGELPIKNVSATPDYGVYLGGHLFLLNAVDMLKDQKNSYTLYWDRSQKPEKGESDMNVYSLFLRANKVTDGTGTIMATGTDIRAFDMGDVINSVDKAEKGSGSKGFILKVNYLSDINQKDSTDLKWASLKIPFLVQSTQPTN